MKFGFTSATKMIDAVTSSKFFKVWEKKFVGADRKKAYEALKNLSDEELQEMAKLVEDVNRIAGTLPKKSISKDPDSVLRNLVQRPLKVN